MLKRNASKRARGRRRLQRRGAEVEERSFHLGTVEGTTCALWFAREDVTAAAVTEGRRRFLPSLAPAIARSFASRSRSIPRACPRPSHPASPAFLCFSNAARNCLFWRSLQSPKFHGRRTLAKMGRRWRWFGSSREVWRRTWRTSGERREGGDGRKSNQRVCGRTFCPAGLGMRGEILLTFATMVLPP